MPTEGDEGREKSSRRQGAAWRAQNVVRDGRLVKRIADDKTRLSVRSVFYAVLAIVRLVRFLSDTKIVTPSHAFVPEVTVRTSFVGVNDEQKGERRRTSTAIAASFASIGSITAGSGATPQGSPAAVPNELSNRTPSERPQSLVVFDGAVVHSDSSSSPSDNDEANPPRGSSNNVRKMSSRVIRNGSIRESMYGLSKISAQLVRLQSLKRIASGASNHPADGTDSNDDEKVENSPHPTDFSGGGSPTLLANATGQADEFEGYSFGTSPSDDDGVDGDFGGHFPERSELVCFPPTLQACVLRRAQEGMSRFLFMYRLKRAMRLRAQRSVAPAYESVPSGVWDASILFKGWPSAVVKELLKRCAVNTFLPGNAVRYLNEPGQVVLLVVEGQLAVSRAASSAIKGCNPSRNSVRVALIKGPCVAWDTAVLVEDLFPHAVHAMTRSRVAVIPRDVVESFISLLPEDARRDLFDRCASRRTIKMLRKVPHTVVRWSPLFRDATSLHVHEVFSLLEPHSFFKGQEIISRHSDDQFALLFIVSGSVVGVGATRGKQNTWNTKVFASFDAPTTVGEKAIYFKEPLLYDIQAKSHCDVLILRSASLNLLMSLHRDLSRVVADGAFQVRGADASVRLLLQTPRSIPCVRHCTANGLITDSFSRDLLALFRFKIFPPGDFIASSSGVVRSLYVIVSGQALVKVSATEQWLIPLHVPIGSALLAGVRWRFAVTARTSCEGWYVPLSDVVALARRYDVFEAMREASATLLDEALAKVPNTGVLELPTPQYIAELDESDKGLHRSGKLKPIRKGIRAFGLISCPVRPPLLPVHIDEVDVIPHSSSTPIRRGLVHGNPETSAQRSKELAALLLKGSRSPCQKRRAASGEESLYPWDRIQPLKEIGSLHSRKNAAVTKLLFNRSQSPGAD